MRRTGAAHGALIARLATTRDEPWGATYCRIPALCADLQPSVDASQVDRSERREWDINNLVYRVYLGSRPPEPLRSRSTTWVG